MRSRCVCCSRSPKRVAQGLLHVPVPVSVPVPESLGERASASQAEIWAGDRARGVMEVPEEGGGRGRRRSRTRRRRSVPQRRVGVGVGVGVRVRGQVRRFAFGCWAECVEKSGRMAPGLGWRSGAAGGSAAASGWLRRHRRSGACAASGAAACRRPQCRFTGAGAPSRGESVMAGSPARSELLSRRSVAPVVPDRGGCIVAPWSWGPRAAGSTPLGGRDVPIHRGWGAQPV